MTTEINVIANCDDAVVFWIVDQPIANCFGFQLERERSLADGSVQRLVLDNRVGFEKDNPAPGDHKPSSQWPFQRFWWADHSVNSGDRVRYRVTPMVFNGGHLVEKIDARSSWTPWTELSGDAGDHMSAFFNRGLVISQFMARYLEKLRVDNGLATREDALKLFKKNLDDHEQPIRKFLSGALRDRMLELLKTAKTEKHHVYGALYELEDDELLTALEGLKSRGHIVLANGSITPKKGESTAEARKRDQNKAGRKRLRDAGLEVINRFISPGALGHNKFLVLAKGTAAAPKPFAAWTGSTNWTKTGLCTQINNGLLVEHTAAAKEYFAQWQRLKAAKSEFPAALVTANSKAKKVTVGNSKMDIWFTRATQKVDLAAIDDVINGAKEGVLFLMFQPGSAGTLGTIRKKLKSPGKMYIKGVVSTLPGDGEDEATVSVHGETSSSVSFDVVQPEGILRPFSSWAATVTRNEFLFGAGKIGFAIVHSKLIVVDPFTKPVVITGSHNFSTAASGKNDENFVIVRGNTALACEYGAHILSVYQHYRWMTFVNAKQKQGQNPKAFLDEDDKWQAGQLKGASRKELDFWVR
ncbi:MAG TPA: phospholipase D-like domain-containing protein [Gammaproteobacteria bacterium]|nr:phospholipase D-like domain-containing protein [Gammaproteobacteria bacterium]